MLGGRYMMRALAVEGVGSAVSVLREAGWEIQVCQADSQTVLRLLRQPFAAVLLPGTDHFACLPTQYRLQRQYTPEPPLLQPIEPIFAAVLPVPDPCRRALLEQIGFNLVLTQPLAAIASAQQLYDAAGVELKEYRRKECDLRAQVQELLRQAGCPPHLKGTLYLCECLAYLTGEPDALYQATKVLYPQVAAQMKTSATNLERSMRTALGRMPGMTHLCITAFLSLALQQLKQQMHDFPA